MKEKTWDITNLRDLETISEEVLQLASNLSVEGAVVLALDGELGAGKTTFTQSLARKLGVEELITSPTFVIMKNYQTKNTRFKELVHIDAYRLESVDELKVLGFETMIKNKDCLICIEWASNVKEILPKELISLEFSLEKDKRLLKSTI